jgi:peroxiredoxin
LRRDYPRFRALDAEILAIAPDSLDRTRAYFREHDLPFPGLADATHAVFDRYNVPSKWVSLDQRPGLFVIDREGRIRFAHVGAQQWQIPDNRQVLALLATLT